MWSINQDSSGFLGFGATSTQKDIVRLYRQFYEYNYQMAWTRRQLSIYTLSVNSFPPPQLTVMTQQAINALPFTFNESSSSNLRKWRAFFDAYGTHFVASADMGGLMWGEDYFESCMITKTTETWIREQIRRRYWFFTETIITEEYTFEIDQLYKQYSMSISKLIGGIDNNPQASSINPYIINAWISSVKNYPQAVAYRILPIYTLLPSGERKEAMKNATYYFRSQAAKDANLFIQRLQSRPDPPPLPKLDCSPTGGRRRKRAKKSVFDLDEARKKLCPVVGFRGTFCPGDPTWNKSNVTIPTSKLSPSDKAISLSPPRDLPKGIGMSVDMSTGNILLPALKLTSPLNPTAESLWKDPHSGRVFILPNEITLEPLRDTMLDANVSSYGTPIELIDSWLRLGADGRWSTSFLSNLQDISDIDATYFSDDQGMAIAQNYSKLYRLKVKNITNPKELPLNSYAQKALAALTSTYDDDLYNAFFNAWGTHVAVATTVGGVTEKQILFQKCLIPSIARLGVAEELLSKRPCISYDYHRWRKLFSDQRIGGNADLIQDTDEWFRTLAYDPALITVQQYIPWSDIVTNGAIKNNLEGAVSNRIKKEDDARQEQVNQVMRQRAAKDISAELILWTVTGTSDMASTTSSANPTIPVTVNNSDICGTGQSAEKLVASCSFTTNMSACALRSNSYTDMNTQVPISYERNLITGDLRVTALRQNGVAGSVTSFKNYDLVGNWIRRGCSEILNDQCGILPSQSVHRVQLCTRCRVLCANKNNDQLNEDCSCPSISQNNCPNYSGIGPYLPYCTNDE
ncbi:unnamed protein product [Rotaria sp. Silwood1]|nr:unnamed protein product [Rotaria sp. Silwood1]CAF4974933.1 unnamed protein product [Rotaria sp. Silwood1]